MYLHRNLLYYTTFKQWLLFSFLFFLLKSLNKIVEQLIHSLYLVFLDISAEKIVQFWKTLFLMDRGDFKDSAMFTFSLLEVKW